MKTIFEPWIEQGKEQGKVLGKELGIEQGIEQGIDIRDHEIVLRMEENGFDIETIRKITGLSIEKIKAILATKKK